MVDMVDLESILLKGEGSSPSFDILHNNTLCRKQCFQIKIYP
jgi:hypothetical protein